MCLVCPDVLMDGKEAFDAYCGVCESHEERGWTISSWVSGHLWDPRDSG